MKTHPAMGKIEGIDGKLYTSDKDKSNPLNKFFSSTFTQNLVKHLDQMVGQLKFLSNVYIYYVTPCLYFL